MGNTKRNPVFGKGIADNMGFRLPVHDKPDLFLYSGSPFIGIFLHGFSEIFKTAHGIVEIRYRFMQC